MNFYLDFETLCGIILAEWLFVSNNGCFSTLGGFCMAMNHKRPELIVFYNNLLTVQSHNVSWYDYKKNYQIDFNKKLDLYTFITHFFVKIENNKVKLKIPLNSLENVEHFWNILVNGTYQKPKLTHIPIGVPPDNAFQFKKFCVDHVLSKVSPLQSPLGSGLRVA
jgi:hypothetical protein